MRLNSTPIEGEKSTTDLDVRDKNNIVKIFAAENSKAVVGTLQLLQEKEVDT